MLRRPFSVSYMLSHEEKAQAALVNDIAISFLDTLCEFGTDIRALGNVFFRERLNDADETPLHTACQLKDRHKPLIYYLGKDKNTPLMAYCSSLIENIDKFNEFLSYPHVINHRDFEGRTALHHLCANAPLSHQVKEKAVRALLDAGADPTIRPENGRTPAGDFPCQKIGL
ncbi:hypothetical protein F5X98DRAFT_359921 [Xylaria grammica]|nr:hypothetical protein F5X98DRAFT_359921 [Xylaria grammica]